MAALGIITLFARLTRQYLMFVLLLIDYDPFVHLMHLRLGVSLSIAQRVVEQLTK